MARSYMETTTDEKQSLITQYESSRDKPAFLKSIGLTRSGYHSMKSRLNAHLERESQPKLPSVALVPVSKIKGREHFVDYATNEKVQLLREYDNLPLELKNDWRIKHG